MPFRSVLTWLTIVSSVLVVVDAEAFGQIGYSTGKVPADPLARFYYHMGAHDLSQAVSLLNKGEDFVSEWIARMEERAAQVKQSPSPEALAQQQAGPNYTLPTGLLRGGPHFVVFEDQPANRLAKQLVVNLERTLDAAPFAQASDEEADALISHYLWAFEACYANGRQNTGKTHPEASILRGRIQKMDDPKLEEFRQTMKDANMAYTAIDSNFVISEVGEVIGPNATVVKLVRRDTHQPGSCEIVRRGSRIEVRGLKHVDSGLQFDLYWKDTAGVDHLTRLHVDVVKQRTTPEWRTPYELIAKANDTHWKAIFFARLGGIEPPARRIDKVVSYLSAAQQYVIAARSERAVQQDSSVSSLLDEYLVRSKRKIQDFNTLKRRKGQRLRGDDVDGAWTSGVATGQVNAAQNSIESHYP